MKLQGIGRRGVLGGASGLLVSPAIVRAEGQNGVALVIGNSKYHWEASLPNARRDATDIAKRFQEMGLKTELLQDAGKHAMEAALVKLREGARGSPLAMFYFAGHGATWEQNTYLVPVDTDLGDPSTVKSLITTRAVITAMQEANCRYLLFDNCRNNPADGWRQVSATDRAQGSARYQLGDGQALPPQTVTLFSTAPGRVAVDGPAGENSPFAAALLRQLAAKSVNLYNLNPAVRRSLLIETEGRQFAWGDGTLSGSHTIAGSGTPPGRPRHSADPSRIVELKNAYAYAKEIQSPIPLGIVAIRPSGNAPGGQFVGSYKFVARDTSPTLWIVLSVTDQVAAIIVSARVAGAPSWRYFPGKLSGDALDGQTWSGGGRYLLKLKDANSGIVSLIGSGSDILSIPYNSPLTRLDG